ncbi:MAG: hypothetical protein L3J78_02430, partial [Thermoplasmata archaeon]|nr:hypothetical protein [Thermoplasmata archaeon]
ELAPLVGEVSAAMAGGIDAVARAAAPLRRHRSKDVHVRVVGLASKPHDRPSRIRAAAVELTRELEVFSLDDWVRVLGGLGVPHAEEALATLIRDNFVFEPKTGFFRAVSIRP